eukprot:125390_1
MSDYPSDQSTTSQSSQSSLIDQLQECRFDDRNSSQYNTNDNDIKEEIKMIHELEKEISSDEDETSSNDHYLFQSPPHSHSKYKNKQQHQRKTHHFASKYISPPMPKYNAFIQRSPISRKRIRNKRSSFHINNTNNSQKRRKVKYTQNNNNNEQIADERVLNMVSRLADIIRPANK